MNVNPIFDPLRSALEEFSLGSRETTTLNIRMLLAIAAEENCTTKHLCQVLGITQSTASRTTQKLGAKWPGKTQSPHLVVSARDKSNPKKYRYKLTEFGRKRVGEITAKIEATAAS